MEPGTSVTWVQLLGAAGFGALIGWFVYYINRYRKGDVQFSDLTTVIGILGGAVVLSLFKPESDLFGAYGIGLFLGFFGYFASMLLLIRSSDNFNADFLLDGRRRVLDGSGYYIPGADEGFTRPAMIPQVPMPAGGAQAMAVIPAQAMLPATQAPAANEQLQEQARQMEANTEALRAASREAQRTLDALVQATEQATRRAVSGLQPAPEAGD